MTRNNLTALITTFAVLLLILAGIVVIVVARTASNTTPDGSSTPPGTSVLRNDTRLLSEAPEGAVEVVEFLDFECESCRAFHPYTEQLRERYGNRVTFAYRYFPLPSHGNSMNAALAVEAAAKQGGMQEMYDRMFETQPEWGERGEDSQADRFRGYAEDLGLDLAEYDANVADPATRERIESDVRDGLALGVESTPTFFVDGQVVMLTAYEDLEAAIVEALS